LIILLIVGADTIAVFDQPTAARAARSVTFGDEKF
jgi:hypothetical protein